MEINIKNFILKLIPSSLRNHLFYTHPEYQKFRNGNISFSQEGEDMVLRRIFSDKPTGVYVDIGAHHPVVLSNTNYFHQKGWSGINIDALPGSKVFFDQQRPNDVNLELLVSENENPTEFFLFDPSLMNTMSKQQAAENKKFEWCKSLGSVMLPSSPLSKLLDKYLTPGTKIDFMSVDVEGAEMIVLKSNNWDKYKPDVLLVEMIDMAIDDILKTEVHQFITAINYNFFAKTGNTVFYKIKGFFEF